MRFLFSIQTKVKKIKELLFLLLLLNFSCSENHSLPHISFYYWKTDFELSSTERNTLNELNVKKLYIRYFDIALKGNEAIPVMPILFKDSLPDAEIIPVIYIKNEVMLSPNTDVDDLVTKTLKLIGQINDSKNIVIKEIQLDCDWSIKSNERFMSFVNQMKLKSKLKISSTIRLHQVKYAQKTGVPDVDYGVLMYYNMGTIATDSLNSIYDRKIAEKYISALEHYPKHLNVALPVYSWIIQSRDGKVIRLISRVRKEDIEKYSSLKKTANQHYEVLESGELFGQYFLKGDHIKLENITKTQLLEMAKDLKKHLKSTPNEIIFYDLEEKNLRAYDVALFRDVIREF